MILIRWRDYEDKDGQIERSAQGKQSRAHPELISPQIKQSSPAQDPGINEKLSSPTVANIRLISQEEYFKYFFMIRFDISMICPPRTSQPLSTVFIKWRAKSLTLTLKYYIAIASLECTLMSLIALLWAAKVRALSNGCQTNSVHCLCAAPNEAVRIK